VTKKNKQLSLGVRLRKDGPVSLANLNFFLSRDTNTLNSLTYFFTLLSNF
jgi:hypothetical protein